MNPARTFAAELNTGWTTGVTTGGKQLEILRAGVADLLNERPVAVGGRVDGAEVGNTFQIDLRRWQQAIEQTKAGAVLIDVLTVFNVERKDVKALVGAIRRAEKLRIGGDLAEAIARIRDVCTWAGHRRRSEPSRYAKLEDYELTDSERDSIKVLLDFIWEWTQRGHHINPEGQARFTEEQARVAIDAAYLFLSFISKSSRVG